MFSILTYGLSVAFFGMLTVFCALIILIGLIKAMEKVLARECLAPSLAVASVVPAMLGESIGDYAALCVAEYGLAE